MATNSKEGKAPTLVFDVIETIFSLAPLRDRMMRAGLPGHSSDLFFAQLLRDAFAISATGHFVPFSRIARATLAVHCANLGLDPDAERDGQILGAFAELLPHEDVAPSLRRLQVAGARVIFLSNGSRSNTMLLVERAGLNHLVERVITVEDVGVWKPHRNLYRAALDMVDCTPADAIMVAAHAWDVQGAMNAGLRGAWIRRQDRLYNEAMAPSHFNATNLEQLVADILADAGVN